MSACVFPSGGDELDDLGVLTALLAENEGFCQEQESQAEADDLDGLFDEDNDEEEYKESIEDEECNVGTVDEVSELFGDVDDIEHEENKSNGAESACESLKRSKEDLQGLLMCRVV